MKAVAIIAACIIIISSSFAYASPFYGRYTKKRGDCSEEYRVDVNAKAFNQYEDMCRVTKVETKPDSYTKMPVSYFDLKCSSEGEVYYQQIWLMQSEKGNNVEAFYPKESPAKTVILYRCR